MPSGSDWTLIWPEAPVDRGKAQSTLRIKRASDPEEVLSSFTLPYAAVRPFERTHFQVFGRTVDIPLIDYWDLQPTKGLERGLLIEVWWMAVTIGSSMRAVLQVDPAGHKRRTVEIVTDDWERDTNHIGRGVRALSLLTSKPGPKTGTVAKIKTREQWHQRIRDRVLTRQTALTADDWIIAEWLGISRTLMFDLMKRWGPKTLAELREGRF